MPRRLLAGVGALTLALLATFVPDIDGVHAATAHCTGWSSTTRPPSTIRVYRSGLHRTVAVDFRQYVRVVVANEWGPTHPRASLRAGAIVDGTIGASSASALLTPTLITPASASAQARRTARSPEKPAPEEPATYRFNDE